MCVGVNSSANGEMIQSGTLNDDLIHNVNSCLCCAIVPLFGYRVVICDSFLKTDNYFI